jgi:hypothetical protein
MFLKIHFAVEKGTVYSPAISLIPSVLSVMAQAL